MVSHAGYDAEKRVLYLTYHSGPTTIAYGNITADDFQQLIRSPYPDVCIRFRIQAAHSFRRVHPSFRPVRFPFVK